MSQPGNDAGTAAIGVRFRAEAGAGLGLGQGAGHAVSGLLDAPRGPGYEVRQVPFYASEFSGSGTFTQPATLGPPTGWLWSVRLLSVTGFTAGTVTVTKNAAAGPLVAEYAAAGPQTFPRGAILLRAGDYLVFTGAGITGTVLPQGEADAFLAQYLGEYLG